MRTHPLCRIPFAGWRSLSSCISAPNCPGQPFGVALVNRNRRRRTSSPSSRATPRRSTPSPSPPTEVRRHRQLRQDAQGVGGGDRQGVQDLRRAAGHTKNLVLAVALSPDGSLLASGGVGQHRQGLGLPDQQSPARVRRQGRRQRRRPQPRRQDSWPAPARTAPSRCGTPPTARNCFDAHRARRGRSLAWPSARNGLLLVTAGADRTLRFWNAANGQPVGVVGPHTGAANAVVFNPNKRRPTASATTALLRFWTVPPACVRGRWRAPHADAVTRRRPVAGRQLDPLGQCRQDGAAVDVRQRPDAYAIRRAGRRRQRRSRLAPNAALVAAGTADQRLFLWNAGRRQADRPGPRPRRARSPASPSTPRRTQIATGGARRPAEAVGAAAAPPPVADRTPTRCTSPRPSADGKRLFTGGADKTVTAWNLAAPAAAGAAVHRPHRRRHTPSPSAPTGSSSPPAATTR